MTKLVRIGKDAELRHTPQGKEVIGLNCVYDIGWGDNKKSQWIEVVIWGKQAASLAPYLLKGKQIVIYADDVELDTFNKNDGTQGTKLKCRAVNIDLTSGGQQQAQPQQAAQAPQQGYQQPAQQQPPQNQGGQQQQERVYGQQNPRPAQDAGFDDALDMPF